ncbi:MAG: TlpA disulfide reductase family protein [Myxococcota bacterium]
MVLAVAVGAVRSLLKDPAPALGSPAPPIAFQTLSGEPFAEETLRGRVVLYELWATWCSGCQAFAPVMRRLDADYRDRGLTVVGVNLGEEVERVSRYVEEKELHYPQVIDGGRFVDTYRLAGTPAYVLLDRQGRVAAIGRRMDAEVVLRGKIEPLLR